MYNIVYVVKTKNIFLFDIVFSVGKKGLMGGKKERVDDGGIVNPGEKES